MSTTADPVAAWCGGQVGRGRGEDGEQGEPWPGIPARGRGASKRAEACWLPIAPGLTPHGLRHTHKTLMREVGAPPKLMDERMGHEDGSAQCRPWWISAWRQMRC